MAVICEICGKQFDSFRGLNGHRNAHIKRAESYKPPASAVKAAQKGLAQRKEWGRGGLSPSEAKSQGIDSGVTRARKIASGSVSRHDVRRMSAFNRHRKNNRPDKKMPDGGPTAGTIAWNLWGGTSGVNWAKKKSAAMNAESEELDQRVSLTKGEIDTIIGAYFSMAHSGVVMAGALGDWKKAWHSKVVDIIKKHPEYADFFLTDTKRFAWTPNQWPQRGGNVWTGDGEIYKAEELSKTSCCCGADESDPCACMKAPEPMSCRAKEPKCACYKALEKNAEGEAPHYYGDCGDCKQPMMLGIEIKDRYGVPSSFTPAISCQECEGVVCGSCHPKVCPLCEESYNAETLDYNSFTNDMEALLAKYSQLLLTYETEYQDGIMEVFMRFKPYNAYFDDVDLDAEADDYICECGSTELRYVEYDNHILNGFFCMNCGLSPCGISETEQRWWRPCTCDLDEFFYRSKSYDAQSFGPVDEDGQLAKALAAVRDKAKRYAPTPLRLTKLPHPDQKTLYDKYEADVITSHRPYPDVWGGNGWYRTSNFCWKCGDTGHHYSRCNSQKYTDALSRKKDMLKSVNAAINSYSWSDSDVEDLKELRRMIKNNHFGIARHYFNSLDTVVRDSIGYETEISFEADWRDLSRDSSGRWLPAGDDSTVSYDMTDMSWMTPSEYYQYVLEEPLDISDDIEDDTQTIEFQDRFVRYTAMTMSPQVIDALIEENELEIVSDLFADPAESEGEIAFLKAVKRYQQFSERYSAE